MSLIRLRWERVVPEIQHAGRRRLPPPPRPPPSFLPQSQRPNSDLQEVERLAARRLHQTLPLAGRSRRSRMGKNIVAYLPSPGTPLPFSMLPTKRELGGRRWFGRETWTSRDAGGWWHVAFATSEQQQCRAATLPAGNDPAFLPSVWVPRLFLSHLPPPRAGASSTQLGDELRLRGQVVALRPGGVAG